MKYNPNIIAQNKYFQLKLKCFKQNQIKYWKLSQISLCWQFLTQTFNFHLEVVTQDLKKAFFISNGLELTNERWNHPQLKTKIEMFILETEIIESYPSQYSHSEIVILAIIITIMMIIVVVGNMLVIIAIATENSLNIVQNWFIASLAFADLSLGLIIMPFSLAHEVNRVFDFHEYYSIKWTHNYWTTITEKILEKQIWKMLLTTTHL